MEDILSSIRRVIARDDSARTGHDEKSVEGEDAESIDPAEPEAEHVEADGDEPLELTEQEDIDPSEERPSLLGGRVRIKRRGQTLQGVPIVGAANGPDAGLVSPTATAVSREILSQLDGTVALDEPTAAEGSATLDGVVRELLRPMLKTWLDDNLPAIVERVVTREVERITRR